MSKSRVAERINLLVLLIVVGVVALGQLQRVQLTPQVSFYIHDALIGGWVIYHLVEGGGKKLLKQMREWGRKYRRIIGAGGVIILAGYIGALLTGTLALTALLYLGRLVVYGLFGYFLWQIKLPQKKYLFPLLGGWFLMGGLAQYILVPDMTWLKPMGWDDHYGRLVGTLWDPAFIGLILVWLLLYLLEKIKINLISFSLIIITLIAILLTYSRSSFLALGVGGVVLGWQRFGEQIKKHKKRAALIVAGVGVVFAGMLAAINRGEMVSTNLLRKESIEVRLVHLQKYTFNLEPHQWLVGRGLFITTGGWDRERYPHLLDDGQSVKQTAYMGDNMFLTVLNFTGVGGLGLFVYVLVKVIKKMMREKPELLPFVAAWMAVGQFNNALLAPFVVVTFIFLPPSQRPNQVLSAKKKPI
ncbi:O-antigen ligase family protein [Microgenomates group bacterium]|nr:O-antigen ligase family protein [Microgenomates group bacterium]